jgi:hypothetical protein
MLEAPPPRIVHSRPASSRRAHIKRAWNKAIARIDAALHEIAGRAAERVSQQGCLVCAKKFTCSFHIVSSDSRPAISWPSFLALYVDRERYDFILMFALR